MDYKPYLELAVEEKVIVSCSSNLSSLYELCIIAFGGYRLIHCLLEDLFVFKALSSLDIQVRASTELESKFT